MVSCGRRLIGDTCRLEHGDHRCRVNSFTCDGTAPVTRGAAPHVNVIARQSPREPRAASEPQAADPGVSRPPTAANGVPPPSCLATSQSRAATRTPWRPLSSKAAGGAPEAVNTSGTVGFT
ncbi:unnamed protein product [Lampetra fluviatilis]